MGRRAAKRYATALIHLTEEQKSMDKLLEQTQIIKNSLEQSSDLRSVLNSPVIVNANKLAIAKSVFKSFDKMLHKLFETLSENNRFDHLKWICQYYASQYNVIHNIRETHIKSAVELDDKTIKLFEEKINAMTGDKAQITTTVDENLIGGFVLNLKDLQYDASISGHIKKLKRNLHTR